MTTRKPLVNNAGVLAEIPSGDQLSIAGIVESTSGGFKFPDGTTQTTASTGGGGGSGITRSVITMSSSITLGSTALTDYVYFVPAAYAPTLPTAVSNTNRYTIKNTSGANITIATTSSQTIDGSTTITIIPLQSVDLISNNANWNLV